MGLINEQQREGPLAKKTAETNEPQQGATDEPQLLKETKRLLTCVLTDEEVLHAGEELAQTLEDISTEESRAQDMKAQLKARMTALESQRSLLAAKVRRREEMRDVAVSLYLHDDGMVHIVREDSGEQIEVRAPYSGELQNDLPLEEEAA